MMSLKFKCPKCSCETLEVIQTDAVMTSEVVDINEQGCFEFDHTDFDEGIVDRFQCYKCGHTLRDEDEGPITTNEDVVEWVKIHCKQENSSG